MATKKKKGNSKAEAMRQMREGAPSATENRPSKKELKKQATEEKKRLAKEAKEAQKAAEKLKREADKAAKKAERELKAAQRKAEKEANRKPKTGALTLEQVTSLGEGAIVPALKELTEDQKIKMADEGDRVIRQLEGRFIQAAIVIRQFMVYELWRLAVNPDTGNRGFKSIEKWAANAMPMSRSERFKAIAVAEKLVPHIPEEDLKKMSSRNVQLLVSVPKAKLSDPEIVEAAKGSEKKLRKTVSRKAPEAQIEESEHVFVPKTVKANLDIAIEAIMALHELDNRAEALEGLGEYFMQGQTENPNFSGMSNRDAYEQLKERQDEGDEPEDVPELHASGE